MRLIALVPWIVAAGCGGSSNTSGIPDECNPLGGQGCLMPWPSMAYAQADTTSATGFRLAIPPEAMPVNGDSIAVSPNWFNTWDGFSPTAQILVAFPSGVSTANLPGFMDPSASLAADSPIILLDMDTGERAPFFAETDQNEAEGPTRDLIIRPLARLHEKARYAVAIRNTVKGADGSDLVSPAAFAAIRDGKSFEHPRFAALQARYADIFDKLSTAGVDKSELVLAWDYVTASDAFLQSDLTTMRTAALPAMGAHGENLTFVATPQTNTAQSYMRYLGTFKSPNFLTDGEVDDSIMVRDTAGLPMMQGLRDANFAAIVPACVSTMPLPRPTIIFGHGIFGSAAEYLDNDFVQSLANEQCFIIIAGDFIGLTSRQLQLAPLAVNDMNRGNQITEKLGQSVIDFMALETIARGPMSTAPEFMFNGKAVIDPTQTFYVGGSLGGIMGNTIMAYDPNLTRGVLAVPGGVWSMLFERSNAWSLLQGAAQGAYTDPAYYQINLALLGMGMEPYDPITTAAHVIKDPLFGNPVKTILMWYSMGDCLVSNITTEFVARTMGIPMLTPAVKTVWGMDTAAGTLVNGINVFNDHPTPLPPTSNVPPATDNGTHSGINQKPAALRFVEQFLLQKTLTQQCLVNGVAAACDCQTGACD
jgi:hypothetical protein